MSGLTKSFVHAARGLGYALVHERNFRVHTTAAVVVVGLAWWWQVNYRDWAILIMTIVTVLTLELMNTAVEKLLDSVHPRLHRTVGVVKDVLAGAVLLAALAAIAIGGLIFIPYFLES